MSNDIDDYATELSDELDDKWPKDGDQLFKLVRWPDGAPVVTDPAERRYRLPKGYKRAGDLLIQHAADGILDGRFLIYTVLYCYRHSIELFLKVLLWDFGSGNVNSHNLEKLWDAFMVIVEDRHDTESVGLSAAEKLVKEMHAADIRADGFRFPADTKDQPFAFGDNSIDLDNLRRVMSGLVNFFECVDLQWTAEDDQRQP
jgi:hypothetical protein